MACTILFSDLGEIQLFKLAHDKIQHICHCAANDQRRENVPQSRQHVYEPFDVDYSQHCQRSERQVRYKRQQTFFVISFHFILLSFHPIMLQQRSDNSQQSVKHGAVIIVPDIVKGYLSALVHCGNVVFFQGFHSTAAIHKRAALKVQEQTSVV